MTPPSPPKDVTAARPSNDDAKTPLAPVQRPDCENLSILPEPAHGNQNNCFVGGPQCSSLNAASVGGTQRCLTVRRLVAASFSLLPHTRFRRACPGRSSQVAATNGCPKNFHCSNVLRPPLRACPDGAIDSLLEPLNVSTSFNGKPQASVFRGHAGACGLPLNAIPFNESGSGRGHESFLQGILGLVTSSTTYKRVH